MLHGRDFYRDRLMELDFDVAINAFFQTNTSGAEILYSIVKDFCSTGQHELALDMYCGTGTIARILAPMFQTVVGIDVVQEAIEGARKAAPDNCIFIVGDAAMILDAGFSRPDAIILDPPRDGVNPRLLPKIAGLGARRIVYVACKPKSLARDIKTLAACGYSPIRLKAVDMFPRTPHVECVALFEPT